MKWIAIMELLGFNDFFFYANLYDLKLLYLQFTRFTISLLKNKIQIDNTTNKINFALILNQIFSLINKIYNLI